MRVPCVRFEIIERAEQENWTSRPLVKGGGGRLHAILDVYRSENVVATTLKADKKKCQERGDTSITLVIFCRRFKFGLVYQ